MEPSESRSEDLAPGEVLDLQQLIRFGARAEELFDVPIYSEVYDRKVAVRIRGLSNYEYDEIAVEMYDEIDDPATIRFALKKREKRPVLDDDGNPKLDDDGNPIMRYDGLFQEELPPSVDASGLAKAYTLRDVLIVWHAMRDFYDGLTVSSVKEMEGISTIARRVDEKSGRTKEVLDRLRKFRARSS